MENFIKSFWDQANLKASKIDDQDKAGQSESSKPLQSFYLGEEEALKKLNEFNEMIEKKSHSFMGYPCNAAFKLSKFFEWLESSALSHTPLNDVGSPHTESQYNLNARPFERQVLHFFAELFSIKSYWGYVTSGGTQGNEQGLYIGRQILANHGQPILYFSEEAHYSIASLGRLLGIESRIIASQVTGEMDYKDLAQKLDPTRPALFSLSIGTTFKGGIDSIEKIQQIIQEKGIQHVFYHADAALFGGYLPFYSNPDKPSLSFSQHPYDSIAVSGHKFFGSPFPLGFFLTHEKYTHLLESEYVEYINTYNVTIPCSRSAFSSLVFWWTISTTPFSEFVHQADTLIANAEYLKNQLQERHYPVWLNPYSNTVYFQLPSSDLCNQWCLATMTCRRLGPLAHIVVMQHVDKNMIDHFLHSLDDELHHKHVA